MSTYFPRWRQQTNCLVIIIFCACPDMLGLRDTAAQAGWATSSCTCLPVNACYKLNI